MLVPFELVRIVNDQGTSFFLHAKTNTSCVRWGVLRVSTWGL